MAIMQIPFVDLKAQYKSIRQDIDSAISSVIADTAFVGGERLQAFETAFANAQGTKHCVGVANGTDALYITMKTLGIGVGDEVITVANSWISTSETITQTGATPVFVDIDQFSNIDAGLIEAAINKRTKAILPVHLYGQPADMNTIVQICDDNNLLLIEDCAQAHLASIDGTPVGTFGKAGTFSFYPGKNLGAYGDAGAIVCADEELALRFRRYANHGALRKHEHEIEGINSRLDGIQAAILSAKLPHLEEWTKARQRVAATYCELLAGIDDLILPAIAPNRSHVFHLFVVRTSHRDALRNYLSQYGVQTGIHYPTALPFLPAYRPFGCTAEQFPRAFQYQNEILSLPLFPELSQEQIDHVVTIVRNFFAG